VIILLNVIIAVISDAFEQASIGSNLLFGKARLQFVAQNEALESFFRPNSSLAASVNNVSGIRKQTLAIAGRLLRWAALFLLISSAVASNIYLYQRVRSTVLSAIDPEQTTIHSSWLSSIITFLCFLVLSLALWIILRITFRGLLQNCSPTLANKWFGDQKSVVHALNGKIATLIFGLGEVSVHAGSDEEADEWHGRMVYLERSIERMIQSAKQELEEDMSALEMRLKKEQNEYRNY